jgi:transmembrane sensor
MTDLYKIIDLSKQIAKSLLKNEKPNALENSDTFNEYDKKYIIRHLTDETLIENRLNLANQIDIKIDREKVGMKLNRPTQLSLWNYAAAATIIGLLTVGYYLSEYEIGYDKDTEPIILDAMSTKAGSNKATLLLGDGSVVTLEKGETYKNSDIISNGEELISKSSKKTKNKLVYNYITVPRGGQFSVKLSDGTQVWLNSDSQLKFPVAFSDGDTRVVELIYGEAYFDVSPSVNHNGSKFKVKNQNQEIEVLGTEFNLRAFKDEKYVFTTLVEGEIVLDNGVSKQKLSPNDQSTLDKESNNMNISKVDVSYEVSWKYGAFSFKDKPLTEIVKIISRWYDIDIVILNKEIENKTFRGVLRKDQNLEALLTIIKNLSVINYYEKNGKQIILK